MELLKKNCWVLVLLCSLSAWGQECPDPIFPAPGQSNVSVISTISWEEVVGVTGYQISLGSIPGGSDILGRTSTGSQASWTPPCSLPDDTEIFVTIYLFFLNQPAIACDTYSFTTEIVDITPGCTTLANPIDGAVNVPVQTDIRWDCSPTATQYRVSLGTSPGGSELVNDQVVSDLLSLDPPGDLPPETEIFVRIIPENLNGLASGCEEYSFTTGIDTPLPDCAVMLSPADGEGNVPLSPLLQWTAVPGAEGYRLSIGTSPFLNDILDNANLGNVTETDVLNFEPNRVYYIRVVPFNIAGEALNCEQTNFSTILGCGPYFDAGGNLIDLSPPLNFPPAIGICGEGDSTVRAEDPADGYRWYRIPPFGREELLAEGPEFEVPETGEYRLEIYNNISGPDGNFECRSEQVFTVTQSEVAVVERTDVQLGAGVITIEVIVSGSGDYEYALDEGGPYQDSNRFVNLPIDNYRVYVRDKNGCGITETLVEPDLSLDGFPKFFTPNGDGINDTWQYIPPPSGINTIRELHIFDRYGKLLAQIDPRSQGWNGTFNGSPLPASDYWFRAVNENNQVLQGHFSLKR
ncbi:T9SS type B sorting domain-containing protein [Robiginitalea aurantiaca]|uniref:T9SS type B sorting domain-containing protein n=1 Tax=Robiginitalea aurantiaca TaxID=3056915 RepID=A0ABT7WCZ4_9FLAO|nr:T9SS type B sorting domain-containing protein [Robiginitalea aurantiaca]MDM9630799.1 T9SS type B sorting domain-containing protein [Robiginitalea aurantiaca]